jgi:hypothetical protein
VLLRLTYLGVTNAFALLRLLPISDHHKDAEIWCCVTRSPCWNANSLPTKSDLRRPIKPSWPRYCTVSPGPR